MAMASYENYDVEAAGLFRVAPAHRFTPVAEPASVRERLVLPMKEHYNVQISVQRVVHPEGPKPGLIPGVPKDREITKLVEIAVTADTEGDAYAKAYRLLQASSPEMLVSFDGAQKDGPLVITPGPV